jgi:hypothetical protein
VHFNEERAKLYTKIFVEFCEPVCETQNYEKHSNLYEILSESLNHHSNLLFPLLQNTDYLRQLFQSILKNTGPHLGKLSELLIKWIKTLCKNQLQAQLKTVSKEIVELLSLTTSSISASMSASEDTRSIITSSKGVQVSILGRKILQLLDMLDALLLEDLEMDQEFEKSGFATLLLVLPVQPAAHVPAPLPQHTP